MKNKIVTIGGGTGQYTLLRGLRNYDVNITALVSMMDDGGDTGRLRDEFGVLPPGDLRRCLIALSNESSILRELFEYRFGNDCVGNRIIGGLQNIVGKEEYIEEISKILRIEGKVLPITLDETDIYAKTDTGKKLEGQTKVSYNINKEERIREIWLDPQAFIFKKAAESIRNSNLILICPGDIYGSIIPNFLIKGMNNSIKETNAKLVYVCNLVTKQGTYKFKASDFVEEIEKYSDRKMDFIVCNITKPTKKIVDKYKGEDSFFVEPNISEVGRKVIKKDLLIEYESNGKIIARHDGEKIARCIMELI